jgi:ribonuclease Z
MREPQAAAFQVLGLKSLESVLVDHCKHSFALSIVSNEGWKFVFSGDTQFCENLITAAQGATVFVHEATFESGRDADARHKKHSTISDALEVCMPSPCCRKCKFFAC